jgi:uncharacterized protein (TIGR02594 family)
VPRPVGLDNFVTEAAVRLYQVSVGIPVDGVAGPETWLFLEKGLRLQQTASFSSKRDPDVPWMTIAKKEKGQKEIRGHQNNPRILEYHMATTLKADNDETPWCSSFVNWCLKEVGITGTKSAAAASWTHWGKASAAKAGAITIIHSPKAAGSGLTSSGYHVGFLVEETVSHYGVVGGNQGNAVRVTSFPKSAWQLIGYRWPSP